MDLNQEFDVSEIEGKVRWKNWRDFVGKIDEKPKTADCVVLFVTFNKAAFCENLLSYLAAQKSNFDVVIVDNFSEASQYARLADFVKSFPRVSLIQTNANIGGGGGYSMALEWCLSRGYEYLLVTEDDAVARQPNIVDEMIASARSNNPVKIRFYHNDSRSFTLHFSLYPRGLVEVAGVPDPRYFMRDDDLEWGTRLESVMERNGYAFTVLEHLEYSHPVYTKNVSIAFEYFSTRNSLRTCTKFGWFKRLSRVIVRTLWVIWSRLFYEGKMSGALPPFLALIDYLKQNAGFQINSKRFKSFINLKPDVRGSYRQGATMQFSSGAALVDFLSVGRNIRRAVSGSKDWAFIHEPQPLWMCVSSAQVVNSFDVESRQVSFSVWQNPYGFKRVRFLIVATLTIISSCVVYPLVLSRAILLRSHFGIRKSSQTI